MWTHNNVQHNFTIKCKKQQSLQNSTTLYSTMHNSTKHIARYRTFNTSQQFYRTSQNLTKLYNTFWKHKYHKHWQTWQTTWQATLQTEYILYRITNRQKLYAKCTTLYTTCTKHYNTIQHCTQLYKIYNIFFAQFYNNFTTLCKFLQNFTKRYNDFFLKNKTLHIFPHFYTKQKLDTQLYKYLCKQNKCTKTAYKQHTKHRTLDSFYTLYNTIQHYTQLCNNSATIQLYQALQSFAKFCITLHMFTKTV